MKYMLLFCQDAAGVAEWESRSQEERDQGYAQIGQWFGANADKIVATHELTGTDTAKTVRFDGGRAVVSDGPFMEAKEAIGGYALVDVADEAAAVELAKGWPPQGTVEVRPVVER